MGPGMRSHRGRHPEAWQIVPHALFKRPRSPFWYLQIRRMGYRIVCSTGTSDVQEAEKIRDEIISLLPPPGNTVHRAAEKHRQIIEQWIDGDSVPDIARQYSLSIWTIYFILKKVQEV